jgi:hypothetical protein
MCIKIFRHWAISSISKNPWAITSKLLGDCPMPPLATPLSIIMFLYLIAAGELTVEVLSVEEEILKIMELCLKQLKTEGVYIPYKPLWNRLRNLYDIPRKRVGRVVQFIKENVFVTKDHLVENDYDIWKSL